MNYINVADARTFDALQSISINNGNLSERDKVITGIAFSPDTSVAYVGMVEDFYRDIGTETELHEFEINTFLKDTIAASGIF